MASPVSIETIPVRKELLKDVTTFAAIDRGCSLTKILYVPKTEPKEDYITLTCAVFHNDDFEDGVDWLTKEGLLPTQGALHVTGAGCDLYRDMIAKKTRLRVEFVNEFHCQFHGSKFLIQTLDDSEFCFPHVEPKFPYKTANEGAFKILEEKMAEKFKSLNPEDRYPLLFASLGSAGGIAKLNADGSKIFCGGSFICGRTLLGLGKLLLGTSNYDEIMNLAAKGNRGKVDTQVQDAFSIDENSPYGIFDPLMPIFPFGKAGETKYDGTEFSKEDIAAALVDMVIANILTFVGNIAREQGCMRVYIGGNLARSEAAREMFYNRPIFTSGPLRFKFLKTGHTGALGAMLTKPGEEEDTLA